MSTRLRFERWLTARREAWRAAFVRGPASAFAFEFISFGVKEAWACLFGGLMLALLVGTFLLYPRDAALPRYDFLTIAAVLIQIGMLASRLETLDEVKTIAVFHIAGTAMEVFKTQVGSWVYPAPSLLRIGGVPLFSGFMYAAVGSYIARIWRIFEFRFERLPPLGWQAGLAAATYVNFFAHHYMPDIRLALFAATVMLYGRTTLLFRPDQAYRRLNLVVGLVLVALFIWFAENLGTFARAWVYPAQHDGWTPVSIEKLGAWFLLMIISFVLVAALHSRRKIMAAAAGAAASAHSGHNLP